MGGPFNLTARALQGRDDHGFGLIDVAPVIDLCPFIGLKVFVMGEEVLNLIHRDLGKIRIGLTLS